MPDHLTGSTQSTDGTSAPESDVRAGPPSLPLEQAGTRQVVTSVLFPVPAEDAWKAILYYEQIDRRPPLLLRVLLPSPIRVSGPKSEVGDESTCEYEQGYLKKRVTAVQPGVCFFFEVFEQSLPVGAARLLGGSYELVATGPQEVRVSLTTRYRSRLRPRVLFGWFEDAICHAFHRHILAAMRASLPLLPTPEEVVASPPEPALQQLTRAGRPQSAGD